MYLFGGLRVTNKSVVTTVDRFSVATGEWGKVAEMRDVRVRFSACSFMRDDVYVIGGRIQGSAPESNCLTTCARWRRTTTLPTSGGACRTWW